MRRIIVSAAAFALALAAAGCPAKKNADLELAAAQAAIDDAKKNRASDCAKALYNSAENLLREARELAEKGDAGKARAKAIEAESQANQARLASPPGCDQPEEVAEEDVNPKGANAQNTSASSNMNLEDVLETVYFDYNQANIREDSKAVLTKVAEVLSGDPKSKIEIEGHCDVRGSTEYNLHLGERRAYAVKKYLTTQGANDNQIEVISYGEERPADLGETESAHARNRRAELKRR